MIASELERAWAAGFFDGEGCTYVQRHSAKNHPGREYRRLRLALAQTNLQPLERFKAAVGCGRINGPYPGRTSKSNEYWVWSVSVWGESKKVIDAIHDMLGPVKQKQIAEAVAEVEETRARKKLKTGPRKRV